jgi:hypothetical protein
MAYIEDDFKKKLIRDSLNLPRHVLGGNCENGVRAVENRARSMLNAKCYRKYSVLGILGDGLWIFLLCLRLSVSGIGMFIIINMALQPFVGP